MKLRYYMRGLGIGVIVAAILMGIALGGDKEKLSDAEIMAKAKELGMVESSYLADLDKEKESEVHSQEEPIEDSKEETSEPSKEKETEGNTNEIVTDKSAEDNNDNEATTDKSAEDNNDNEATTDKSAEDNNDNEATTDKSAEDKEQYVTLIVEKGESSVSVSKSLEKLGLVDSAKAYDRYLCENGYDKLIRVGTHKIKVGSTDEEIATIISRKKK